MLALAGIALLLGYGLFYSGASQLAHGPGNGVGFLEVMGLSASAAAATTSPGNPGSPHAPSRHTPGAASGNLNGDVVNGGRS